MLKLSTRVAGIAGLVFFLLIAVPGFLSGAPPDASDPAGKFLSYAGDHRTGLMVASILGVTANFFALFFVGGLLAALRRLGAAPALLLAALGAFLLAGATNSAGAVLGITEVFRLDSSQHVDAETVRLLSDGMGISFSVISFPVAAFLVSAGLMFLEARLFPAWLGWVGVAGGLLEFVGGFSALSNSGAYSPYGVLGLVLGLLPFGIFVLATSIVLMMRGAAMDASDGVGA